MPERFRIWVTPKYSPELPPAQTMFLLPENTAISPSILPARECFIGSFGDKKLPLFIQNNGSEKGYSVVKCFTA